MTVTPFRIAVVALLSASGAVAALPAAAQELTPAALTGWLTRYERAWEMRSADQAAALFTEGGSYHEMPFDKPMVGRAAIRDYWTTVTADQRNIDFQAEIVSISGNTGVAHWSASFKQAATGAALELDGVFVLTFDSMGRCESLKEWWHLKP